MLEESFYERNRERIIKRVQKRQYSIKDWFDKYRIGRKCKDCNIVAEKKFLKEFDFHHVDPSTKEFVVSDMVCKGYCIASILREIKKCVFLCSECHAGRHQ